MASISAAELEDKREPIDPLCALSNFTDGLCRFICDGRWERRDAAIEGEDTAGISMAGIKEIGSVMMGVS